MACMATATVKLYVILLIPILSKVIQIESKTTIKYSRQKVVLISFDGFRHDFIDLGKLQHFKKFAREGVKAKSLQPTFVTKTFPNHFTMVTGLYEESHGIISNHMYDPVYNETFHPDTSSLDPKWWNSSTPLWILNEQQIIKGTNKTGKSATIFWPGSETSYNGKFPSFTFKKYSSNITTKERLKKIVHLMAEDPELNFVACYIEQPDGTAHEFGPDSPETLKELKKLDETFGYFIAMMKAANLYDKVNIMVVSDHGFAEIPHSNIMYLSDYLEDPSEYHLDSYGTFLLIRPTKSNATVIYKALKNVTHLSVYHKKDIPERWHYKHNRRIPEIFAVADEGYYIVPNRNSKYHPRGDHGYDNKLLSMHGIFLARGPAFKQNLKVDTIQNVDLCPLMCHILGLIPHPHNGSLEIMIGLMSEKTIFTVIMKKPAFMIALFSICGVFVAAIILGCTISCFRNFVESSKYRRPVHEDTIPLANWHDDDDTDEVTEYQFGSGR